MSNLIFSNTYRDSRNVEYTTKLYNNRIVCVDHNRTAVYSIKHIGEFVMDLPEKAPYSVIAMIDGERRAIGFFGELEVCEQFFNILEELI